MRFTSQMSSDLASPLQFDIENRMDTDAKDSFNVTADLPGGTKKDEWSCSIPTSVRGLEGPAPQTPGAGSAVTMEAIRILKALNRRNIPRAPTTPIWISMIVPAAGPDAGFGH